MQLNLNVVHATLSNVAKVASLVSAGHVIETVDGHRYRVASKITTTGRVFFNLSTPAGYLRVTASDLAAMEPLPRGIARLAHVLRCLAYNKDFDTYVKEAIKAHGLPLDPEMNWSKWLYGYFFKKYLKSAAPGDLLDETFHQFIIDLIYEKDVLESFNPKKIRKERNKKQNLGRQVSIYLMQQFITYRSMAQRILNRLETTIPGRKHDTGVRENLGMPMEQPGVGESGEEYATNLLDTETFATEPKQQEVESWEDIARFRQAYGDWLTNAQHEETTDNIITLFDLIVNAERRQEGGVDYKEEWIRETGKSLPSYGLTARNLSETLHKFVAEHPELAETSLIARLIADIKTKKPTTKSKNEGAKSVPRAASLNLVAMAPSELAQMPGDTGRLPHDNTGNESNAAIILDEKPEPPKRTVVPEIPVVQHGF